MENQKNITLTLEMDEAIVLWDLLIRAGEEKKVNLEGPELRALWNLECLVEKEIPTWVHVDWKANLEAARTRLTDT